jgi:hypothetical protein
VTATMIAGTITTSPSSDPETKRSEFIVGAADWFLEKTLHLCSISESSRNSKDQNRYVVMPMAAAEGSRSVKNSFLQFSSGGGAVLLEKAEQPRFSELLALGIVRFRHSVGE